VIASVYIVLSNYYCCLCLDNY